MLRALPCGLFLYTLALSLFKIRDLDFWWHLKNGEHLLATGRLTGPDVFAYTSTNPSWVQHYWLFDVLLFLAFKAGGFAGLGLFRAALIVIIFWALYRLTELSAERSRSSVSTCSDELEGRWFNTGMNVLLVALAVGASRPRFFLRAELASFLLFVLALRLLLTRQNRSFRSLLWLLPLQMLWANVHASFVLGLLLPWPFLLTDSFRAFRHKTRSNSQPPEGRERWTILAVLAVLLPLVSLANPSGYRLLLHPFQTQAMANLQLISEWRSPIELMRLGEFVTYPDYWILLALLGIALLLAAFLVRPFDLAMGSLALFFAILSLNYLRMIPYLALAAPPCIAMVLPALLPRLIQLRHRFVNVIRLAAPLVLWLAIVALGFQRLARDPQFLPGLGVDEWAVPSSAARFIEQVNLEGRMLNSYPLGGYLIWRLGPHRKVFIDGRYGTNSPFPDSLLDEYRNAFQSADRFQAFASKHDVAYAILRSDDCLTFEQLGLGRIWALVFWDDTACIYLGRRPEHGPLIEAYEYHLARYGLEDPNLLSYQQDPVQTAKAVEEFQRAIDSSPFHERALQGQAYLYSTLGASSYEKALTNLEAILRLNPRSSWAYLMRALISSNRHDDDAALRDAEAALRLNPADPTPYAVLAKSHARQGKQEEAKREWATYQRLRVKRAMREGERSGLNDESR